MIITLDNFQKGLKWRNKYGWVEGVRNDEYYEIYNARAQGITELWWNDTVNRLGRWRANRPQSKDTIYKRGICQLKYISQQYQKIFSKNEPCITNLEWAAVDRLFELACAIKQGKGNSPVFASKMCHFLFPNLFIVMDNVATGVFHYELYWRGLKEGWNEFAQQNEARGMLIEAINKSPKSSLHPNYPMETMIMEVCATGYNQR